MSINTAVIMGRLTADPELKTTASGLSVLSFSVAVERNYQKEGEEKAVDFILEIITNPNIKNNAFDEKTFSITKDILKEEIETFNYKTKSIFRF